jgi:TolB-like protein/DNA-binding winged helix-turn-helix (wHTH) protein/Tfp pilus assembly protein PilF
MGGHRQYLFGEFRLDAEQRALFRRDEFVPVAPKLLETLIFLVERHGRIVEKKELMDSVWPGLVVEEVGLARNVSILRKVLSAGQDAQSCIETVPKRGYRFVAPVEDAVSYESRPEQSQEEVPEEPRARGAADAHRAAAAPRRSAASAATDAPPVADVAAVTAVLGATDSYNAPATPDSARTATATRKAQPEAARSPTTHPNPQGAPVFSAKGSAARHSIPNIRLSVVLALLVLAAAGSLLLWHSKTTQAPTPSHRAMLAVLPVRNLTGDPSREYESDGMTEELITQLGGMDPEYIGVIARRSSMAYKNTQKTVGEIGRELGVDYVLEGSLRTDEQRKRFTAQLIRTSDQTHLWAKDYDRDSQNLLALEDEIGQTVAREIETRLTSQPRARKSRPLAVNPASYQEYLLGRYYWNKGDEESLTSSIEHYRQALTQDPQNALAQAGLADSYSSLSDWYLPPRAVMPEARAAATRALELDESLSAAHNALCVILTNYEWSWSAAERECRRAIELNPNSADAHDSYGYLLAYVGRAAEASAEMHRAEELDPLSFRIYCDGAFVEFLARNYQFAVEQAKRSIDLAPDYFLSHSYLALIYVQLERNDEAVAEAEKGVRLTDSSLVEGFLGYVYAATGRTAQARQVVDHLTRRRAQHFICAFELGTTHLWLGEKDEAFRWFELAYDDRSLCITSMKFDPRLDPVRTDQRFISLIRRAGFP